MRAKPASRVRIPPAPPISKVTQAAPVNSVSYASLTGTEIVDFDDLPSASASGSNYDSSFISRGVGFGERFNGQSLGASGNFDTLGSSASGSLAVVAGTPNHNLD